MSSISNFSQQVKLPPDIDSVVNEVSDTLNGEDSPLDVLSESGDYLELSRQVTMYGSLFNVPRDNDNNGTQKDARVQVNFIFFYFCTNRITSILSIRADDSTFNVSKSKINFILYNQLFEALSRSIYLMLVATKTWWWLLWNSSSKNIISTFLP